MKTPSKRTNWTALGLAIIVFFSCVSAAELYCRLILKPVDLMELTGMKPTACATEWAVTEPFSAYRGKPGYVYKNKKFHKKTNEFGFISSPSISMRKPADTIRIVFLGESSTACIFVSDGDTWPWKVVKLLKKEFPSKKFDFINAGVPGYTSFESYGRLWSRIRFFKPDLICANHGWNEMYYFNKSKVDSMMNWRSGPGGDWNYNQTQFLETVKPLPIDSWIRRSQLLTRIRLNWAKKRTGEVAPKEKWIMPQEYDSRGAEIFRDNLRLIKTASKLMGAELFVIKQATLIAPGLSPEQQMRCHFDYHGFDFKTHLSAFRLIYQAVQDEIEPNRIIDVTPLSGFPAFFMDHIHLTPKGCDAMSRIVFESIASWVRNAQKG